MAFLDPPYNVSVRDIVGRGRVKHTEFAMASGELSRGDFVEFLQSTLAAAAAVSRDGAVHFVCMDWRHIGELLEAGGAVYDDILNVAEIVGAAGITAEDAVMAQLPAGPRHRRQQDRGKCGLGPRAPGGGAARARGAPSCRGSRHLDHRLCAGRDRSADR